MPLVSAAACPPTTPPSPNSPSSVSRSGIAPALASCAEATASPTSTSVPPPGYPHSPTLLPNAPLPNVNVTVVAAIHHPIPSPPLLDWNTTMPPPVLPHDQPPCILPREPQFSGFTSVVIVPTQQFSGFTSTIPAPAPTTAFQLSTLGPPRPSSAITPASSPLSISTLGLPPASTIPFSLQFSTLGRPSLAPTPTPSTSSQTAASPAPSSPSSSALAQSAVISSSSSASASPTIPPVPGGQSARASTDNLSAGAIVGICIGIAVLVLVGFGYLMRRRRRRAALRAIPPAAPSVDSGPTLVEAPPIIRSHVSYERAMGEPERPPRYASPVYSPTQRAPHERGSYYSTSRLKPISRATSYRPRSDLASSAGSSTYRPARERTTSREEIFARVRAQQSELYTNTSRAEAYARAQRARAKSKEDMPVVPETEEATTLTAEHDPQAPTSGTGLSGETSGTGTGTGTGLSDETRLGLSGGWEILRSPTATTVSSAQGPRRVKSPTGPRPQVRGATRYGPPAPGQARVLRTKPSNPF